MASKKNKEYTLDEIREMLPEEILKVNSGMIEDALFMEERLKELREVIRRDGVSEQYQYGSKQTAAMTTYLQVQKQYGTIIRHLTDLLPKQEKSAAPAKLLDWVNSN